MPAVPGLAKETASVACGGDLTVIRIGVEDVKIIISNQACIEELLIHRAWGNGRSSKNRVIGVIG
jgi:hypothetical protein